jgi:PhnB protein
MKALTTYLTFDGNCLEAMTFYAKCLDAPLDVIKFSDTPGEHAKAAGDRIMHARLSKGSAQLMASDSMPGSPLKVGDNFSIAIQCESKQEVDTLFNALSEGGTVTLPPQDTFWNAYFAMATDRFGIHWMFNHEYAKA